MYVCILSRNIYFAILPWHAYIASALFKVCRVQQYQQTPAVLLKAKRGCKRVAFRSLK